MTTATTTSTARNAAASSPYYVGPHIEPVTPTEPADMRTTSTAAHWPVGVPQAAYDGARFTHPVVDVVIPVYNEQADLASSVYQLSDYLRANLPHSARITVADNASTDGTWSIAMQLAAARAAERENDPTAPEIRAVHLDAKGRGRALRQVWLMSDADVLAYMDVDLSTHLEALPALVAPLISGHSQLAIGTRLARTSRVERGFKREMISRCYNQLLRRTMSARFSDAQCGFKAITRAAAQEILPLVEDTGWFFDTEMLVLAERAGLRIHEVPVDWVDDPDSHVDIVSTAIEDLKGMVRVRRNLAAGKISLAGIGNRLGLGRPGGPVQTLGNQIFRFAVVGVMCTAFYSLLYLLLRGVIDPQIANFVAYAASAILGTGLHRRITFGIKDPATVAKHHGQGLIVFAASWGLSAIALLGLHSAVPDPSAFVEVALLTCANLVATAARFVLFRSWVFRAWTRPRH